MKNWKLVNSKWLWFAGFVLAYLALRIFWITGDTGIPSIWEYGFHTTDEGYYLCGGKEKFLWGSFVDLTREEALNYCYSYGTHWLSYLAHLCFGLSTWTWRIPFVGLYLTAWIMMFWYVAKHSGGWFAFATCLAASSLPIVITYERGASNDATIAALTAIAFALAAGKGRWRIFASALAVSAICTVKPAVWVMAPMVTAALLEDRKTRSRWLDVGLLVATALIMTHVWKWLSAWTVAGVATQNGISTWQVLAKVNATYGLPTIWDIAQDFRALASFPRDPAVRTMGPTIILISVVPVTMLLINMLRRKWNGHLLMYLMIPLYAYALNVINSMYTHYFLPLLMMLPALFSVMREDFADLADEHVDWKSMLSSLMLLLAAIAIGMVFVMSSQFPMQQAAPLYSRIYNLPNSNPWSMTWPVVAVGTLFATGIIAAFRGAKPLMRESWAWIVTSFLTMSIVAAALPAASISTKLRLDSAVFYWTMALNLAVGCIFSFVAFVRPAALARPLVVASMLVLPVVASYALLPTWRSAAVELVTRHTHYDAALAAELKKLLPKDAIVLGERTDQALFSLPIRSVSTFLSASNPIPYVERIRKINPKTPLYALIDPQCPYNLQHFRKHANEYRLDVVQKFQMPSTADGKLSDVYLCRITCLHQQREAGR